jgi:hypothetical protein
VEVVIEGDKAKVTAHGPKGQRRVVLPGKWQAAGPLRAGGGVLMWGYEGGAPVSVTIQKEAQ